MAFSTDRDLLVFEPRLFCDFALPAQTLASGSDGVLAGTVFTTAAGGLIAAGLAPGMVLTVRPADGPAATLEIVSIDSATHATVSTLRADSTSPARATTISGNHLPWSVASFAPQAEAVAAEIIAHFGISPANPTSRWTSADILNPQALRPVSAYGVLSMVLAGAANRGDPADGLWAKATHYRARFEQLLSQIELGLDRDDDGKADEVRYGGAPRLRRD
jgi:hypothetical protein